MFRGKLLISIRKWMAFVLGNVGGGGGGDGGGGLGQEIVTFQLRWWNF